MKTGPKRRAPARALRPAVERLRRVREEAQLSRADLARGAGLSYATLASAESGRFNPRPETIERMEKGLVKILRERAIHLTKLAHELGKPPDLVTVGEETQ